MLTVRAEIPDPSQFVKHDTIDGIAMEYSKAYREQGNKKAGYPVDAELLTDLLEISVLWEDVEEPSGALFLARYTPPPEEKITINQRHTDLFDERPYVFAAALGHEIGHKVLRHSEHSETVTIAPTLFSVDPPKAQQFHKSSWGQYGMSKEDVEKRKALVQEVAKRAMVSQDARQLIAQLQCFYEPEWMFWQAEHFSRCLLVPKDLLFAELEKAWDLSRWADIYRLGELFGVSGPMMKARLVKLGIIEIGKDSQPRAVQSPRQSGLFN
jgi:hypothetical protein